MIRSIFLYGHLADIYGRKHSFDARSALELFSALNANHPSFKSHLKQIDEYYVFARDEENDNSRLLTRENLKSHLIKNEDVHIVPKLLGSEGFSFAAIAASLMTTLYTGPVMGMSLLASSIAAQIGGFILSTTLGMALSFGASQLLAPTPEVSNYDSREQTKSSFLFNGTVNRTEQGGAVPLTFGEFRIGSTRGSGSIMTEKIVKGKVIN